MRARATAATAALLLAVLTACGGGDGDSSSSKPKPRASAGKEKSVDCTDESLDQADWMEHCADEAGTGGDGTEGQATGLEFGESYEWPDGLKVTVVDAKVFTDYDPGLLESAEPCRRSSRGRRTAGKPPSLPSRRVHSRSRAGSLRV
ncbi:hypothetical protein [Streptomyces prasinus]|uniref:hypothetical protein n=1 Tax=Streptomyces prasinus TaxID=67345 RepID=UPI0033B2DA76